MDSYYVARLETVKEDSLCIINNIEIQKFGFFSVSCCTMCYGHIHSSYLLFIVLTKQFINAIHLWSYSIITLRQKTPFLSFPRL